MTMTPIRLFSTILFVLIAGAASQARVDQRFLQMWESAQRQRPDRLASTSRIAPASEPGTPLRVRGQVLDGDDKPTPGVIVFAYHTDNTGVYAPPGASDPWRLKGWVVTDANGRFQFDTIRPAPYPGGQIPAHIHITLITSCCGRQSNELMFEGDPILTDAYKARFARAGEHGIYGHAHQVAGGSQEVQLTMRIRPTADF